MHPIKALLIVDPQVDFCEGGALPVDGGHAVTRRITEYARATKGSQYALIVATRDWHDPQGDNGGHFAADGQDPDYDTTWPVHCVAHTSGAAYAPGFDPDVADLHVVKGVGAPAYSGFEGVTDTTAPISLRQVLADHQVQAVDVVGLAQDYCVKQTARDAALCGLQTTVLGDLTAPVNPATAQSVRADLESLGVVTVDGSQDIAAAERDRAQEVSR